ncbi:MAG: response regulator [Bacteroidales bacterium]
MIQETGTKTVLIIEDDRGITELITECFEEIGFRVFSKSLAGDALLWMEDHEPYLIALDYGLPDMNAREFILEWRKRGKALPPFIVFTGQGGELIATEMMKLGARDYIIKDSGFLGILPEIIKRIDKEIENENRRKKTEAELKKLSAAIRQSPVSVVITNKEGIIEYVNPKFCELTEYTAEEVNGQNLRILNAGTQPKELYADLWNTILAGKNWKGELHNKKKNGELYWEEVVISSILDDEGNITHFVAVKEDITEKKKIWTNWQIAKEKAEESDRLKSAFLANMSHEIRTPLNAIVGFSNLLADADLNQDTRKTYSDIIQANTSSLLVLIDDIIDLSRIEASQLSLNFSNFDAIELFNELAWEHREPTANGVIFQLDESLKMEGLILYSDRIRFKQVLNNLVSNALKYTEQGTVIAGISAISDKEVSFFVRDTGIGIAPPDQSIIFDRFRKADNHSGKKYSGAGLGLTITKKLVELSGGSISLESAPGKGSVFTFTQLLASGSKPVDPAISTPASPQQFHGSGETPLVAVAEDSDDNYLLLEIMLKHLKYNCRRFRDGKEISDHFLALEKPDARFILMDIRMPVMDGFEAARLILQKFPGLPIIAQTAHAMLTDLEKIRKAGFAETLTKPFNMDNLSQSILNIAHRMNQVP